MANPFNPEFEAFVSDGPRPDRPILRAVESTAQEAKSKQVQKLWIAFTRKPSAPGSYESEVTCAYQKRFDRYRESLFVFLAEDNIRLDNTWPRGQSRSWQSEKISGSFLKVCASVSLVAGIANPEISGEGVSEVSSLLGERRGAFRALAKKIAIAVGPPQRLPVMTRHPASALSEYTV